MFLQVSFPPRRLSYQTFAPFVRTIIADTLQKVDDVHPAMFFWRILAFLLSVLVILGDPGAVSRAGRKVATKVLRHRRKSPWVPILTGPFPNGQANAGWLADWAQKKCFVLLCPIGEQHLQSSFREFVHECLSRHSCPVRSQSFPNLKRRKYRWVVNRFGCYQQEQEP